MNNRNRVMNSVICGEAVIASSIGLIMIMRPVVRRRMSRL